MNPRQILLGVAALGAMALGPMTVIAARRTLLVVRVHGHSMSPTYADGDRLLVRRTRTFRRGDVVVFPAPAGHRVAGDPRWLVKRVAEVGEGRLTVLGDNPRSLDSRAFGSIPAATAVGVALRRLRRPQAPASAGPAPAPTAQPSPSPVNPPVAGHPPVPPVPSPAAPVPVQPSEQS